MQTPLFPIMDNLYLDTYYFFVPNRLIWDNWKEFMGENNTSKWIPSAERHVPSISFPIITDGVDTFTTLFPVGSVADYLGLPAGEHVVSTMSQGHSVIWPHAPRGILEDYDINNPQASGSKYSWDSAPAYNSGFTINHLPFRAYCLVVNDWFRDENLEDPLFFPTSDYATIARYDSNRLTAAEKTQFSDIATELNSAAHGGAPYIVNKYHDYFTSALPSPQKAGDTVVIPVGSMTEYYQSDPATAATSVPQAEYYIMRDSITGALTAVDSMDDGLQAVYMRSELPVIDINSIRLAFATQAQYELDARGGTRYTELIRSNFGTVSPDARLQRSEYLGGNHTPININQVVSQASTSGVTTDTGRGAIGDTGAYSLTADSHGDFIQSFTEHGIVIGVCCVRFDHSYQQGINRMFKRWNRFDYYFPAFANIGEQPIKTSEIFVDGATTESDVFGFQEAWSEYRFAPNRVSGEMRSNSDLSLDSWHLADDYASAPQLSREWLKEDKRLLDRCLKVTSEDANQFFADFYCDVKGTLPMPMYSTPATLGHF